MLIIFVWLTVNKTSDVSDGTLIGFLGFFILLFVIVNISKNAPYIPNHHDIKAQIISGLIAGVMGGLTSVWPLHLQFIWQQDEPQKKNSYVLVV